MSCIRYIFGLLLLLGLGGVGHAAKLKVVVLDSNSAHGLRGKLVCLKFPATNPADAIVEHARDCQRTDSGGTAVFALPDPAPEKVEVFFATDGLRPCFSPHTVTLADAMDKGMVVKNTCGTASTDTTETGEVILFAHQKSLKEALDSVQNEW
jgi:hypothetical protein